jgi:hypothetical protein
MDYLVDDPMGLDPLSPLPSRDPRWFVPAHEAWNSARTALADHDQSAVAVARRAQEEALPS